MGCVKYPFRGTADTGEKIVKRDVATLHEWESYRISTHTAALRIARNNRDYVMQDDEFEAIANSLGYKRDEMAVMEAWRRKLIDDDQATKEISKIYGAEMSVDAFKKVACLI